MKTMNAGDIAAKLNGKLIGNSDVQVKGVASLTEASSSEISFMGDIKYEKDALTSKASILLIPKEGFQHEVPFGKAWIRCENPNLSFNRIVLEFAPPAVNYKSGIHPSAVVSSSAEIDPSCHIGPNAVIEDGVKIGKNSKICAGSYVGEFSIIGKDCHIFQGVTIRERTVIGNEVIIHPNVSIGADGFGFEAGPTGIVKIPQVGYVQIDDYVEIGANTTIDRARFGKTWIKMGVKIDDQVHIAHNVVIGEFSMVIGQAGIAGSTKIGQGVIVAAQAGISHHLNIGDGCRIAGAAGVTKNWEPGSTIVGGPAEPVRDFVFRLGLPKFVKKLQARIEKLEKLINQKN